MSQFLLRSIMRVPMASFEYYGTLSAKYPQFINYWAFVSTMVFITMCGKGAEKLTLRNYIK